MARFFYKEPTFTRILDYEGFQYKPSTGGAVLLAAFGVEYWRCELKRCSGRLRRVGRICTLTNRHNCAIVPANSEWESITAEVDRAGAETSGLPDLVKSTKAKSRTGTRKHCGEANKAFEPMMKTAKPKQKTLNPIPEENTAATKQRPLITGIEKGRVPKGIIGIKTDKTGVRMFLVQWYGAYEPDFVPIYHAHQRWPKMVIDFMADEACTRYAAREQSRLDDNNN